MNRKILSLASFAVAISLGACSSSGSSSSPSDPGDVSSSAGTSQGGGITSSTSTSALATTANALYPQALYGTWKGFHYVDEETEMVYYPSLASEFVHVFPAGGAGRIKWSVQASGTYKSQCTVSDATDPSMQKRGCTVSEGIGYGMLISAFQGDYEVFNRLWAYNKGYRAYSGSQLMPWITYSFHYNEIDNSSATDADLDIATALILVYLKTGVADYLTDALTIAAAIWNEEVNPSNLLLYSGNTSMWTGADPAYNLSYFSPVALRLFAMFDNTHDWKGVLDAGYAYMQKVQAAGTGVLPDWSNGAGVATMPPNGSANTTYMLFNKESVRIPWRIAWDYYWFQDERAASVLNTLNAFISARTNGDPAQVSGNIYSWDPNTADNANSTPSAMWFAAWCATGIAGNAAWLESCTNLLNATEMTTSGSSYFSNMLQMMYSQLLNGMYTKPF